MTDFEPCYRGSTAAPPPHHPETDGPTKPFEFWADQQAEGLRAGVGNALFEWMEGAKMKKEIAYV